MNLQLTPSPLRIETLRVTSKISNDLRVATVEAVVDCFGEAPRSSATITVEIDGVTQATVSDAAGRATVYQVIHQPRLWDVGQPELYTLRVTIQKAGQTVDAMNRPLGFAPSKSARTNFS